MALTKTAQRRYFDPAIGGLAVEEGIYVADGGTTSGRITAEITTTAPVIGKITDFKFMSNTDGRDVIVTLATDALPNAVDITITANDAGTYRLVGPSVQ